MADTTIIRQVFIDTVRLDSINHKLALLQNSNSSSPLSLWIPLVASIIGGLLVWAGQAIERDRRRKSEQRNSLLEIYSFCRKLEAIMRNHYRELAMAKFHAEFWWHCHLVEHVDKPHKMKAYDEHLKSQAFAREIERQIGITKADFIGHVRKFQAIKELPNEIENLLERISDLTHPQAKFYDSSITHLKLRYELAEKDEKELRDKYYENLVPFKTVNNIIQKNLK